MQETYLMPTQAAGRDFIMKQIQGPVVMLNLLRFRGTANYAISPELAPAQPISGKQTFRLYVEHSLPFLQASGGEVLFMGKSDTFLIGPSDERWDFVMLIKQSSVSSFMAFESNEAYMKGVGHLTAALEEARLLPVVAQ